jgi:hypothetical protein
MLVPLMIWLTTAPMPAPSKTPGAERVKPEPSTAARLVRQEAVAAVEKVAHHRVTLVRPGAPLEIEVNDVTPVFIEGRVGTFADVKPGQEVRVSYDAVKGPAKANWIQVLPGKPVDRNFDPMRRTK